jgi:hypothetical protein
MGQVFWLVITGRRPSLFPVLRLISVPADTSVPGAVIEPNTQCSRQELLRTGLTSGQAVLDYPLIHSIQAIVMGLSTIESSFVSLTANGIQGFDHAEFPVIWLALEILNATEGYLWVGLCSQLRLTVISSIIYSVTSAVLDSHMERLCIWTLKQVCCNSHCTEYVVNVQPIFPF